MRIKIFIIGNSLIAAITMNSCGQTNPSISKESGSTLQALSREIIVSDGCDGCDLIYEGMPSPDMLTWTTSLSNSSEPGEPMEISGVIYQTDGKTPASNIILYVYHTDAKGYYSSSDTQTVAKRHGHLRGWMLTNDKGQYKFATIRPAQYPNESMSAHIHPVIKEPNKIEYYIDEFVFDDDTKLTQQEKDKHQNRGGSGIIHLTKNEVGVWIGHRDIILGLNIPNYK